MPDFDWPNIMTDRRPWDVVVIGAGPAGALAARQLALCGCRVLLIEKSAWPRSKVCGGCLGGVALDVLERVGLGELPHLLGAAPLRQFQLADGRSSATIDIGRRLAVSRETFDAALVQQAVGAGATFCDRTEGWLSPAQDTQIRRVTIRRQATRVTLSARAVLIATGLARAPQGFRAHIRRRSPIGLGTVLSRTAAMPARATLQMALGSRGYVGVAEVERGRVAVAAAVTAAALAAACSPAALVTRMLADVGLAVPVELESAAWRGTPRFVRSCQPLASHRCLLIGDAAAYAEPLTGEGIGWALLSALLASRFLRERLERWDTNAARQWHSIYRRAMVPGQRQCRAIGSLFRYPTPRCLTIWWLRRAPGVAEPFVRRIDQLPPLVRPLLGTME
jgi:flavin-dependent dehydrogenase